MRKFKQEVLKFLQQENFIENLEQIHSFPSPKIINSLFTFLCSTDRTIKEHTVIAMGEVVSKLAEDDIESARIVMRRLMLNLNDESGGIGWGAPEAMGEIMARNKQLAEEYHKMLISYAEDGGNFLDFEELQKEVISGLKRLSKAHPQLVKEVKYLLG